MTVANISLRMSADELAGHTVFSKRPDLGYFRNWDRINDRGPIRWDEPLGPWIVRKWCGRTGIYEYTADAERPLTMVLADGTEIQPDKHFETDMGSVPLRIQALPGGLFQKDRWLAAYILHDSGYSHGGLWVRRPGEGAFHFEPMTKAQVDDLLRTGILILGGPSWNANVIHWAVDEFGTGIWSHREPARVAWKMKNHMDAGIGAA